MNENNSVEARKIRQNLDLILEHFSNFQQANAKVAFYSLIALKISKVINQNPPWTWRYVQMVHRGTLQPSKRFGRAVMALGAAIDEVPSLVIDTEAIQVYAKIGSVLPGSVVMARSKICANPGCRASFVPNVPWRRLCPACNPPTNRKET